MTKGDLFEKYKHLFVIPFWGFEVPDGWLWIVEKYLEKTQFDVDENKLGIKIEQIKEKYASLCIYTYVENNISRLDQENIAYCEALADYTCEKCGCMSKEKQYTKGWIVGLCPTCLKEREDGLQKNDQERAS